MAEFVQDQAIVVGQLRYPRKNLDGIEHLTVTWVYRVHTVRHHIPKRINLFSRQIKCVYDGQPKENIRQQSQHSSSKTLTEKSEPESDTESQSQTYTQTETNQNLQQDMETNQNQYSTKENKQDTNHTKKQQNENKSEKQPTIKRQVNQHLQ